jgi:hypothetical protein
MENQTIILHHVTASQAIDYKNQLLSRGLILDIDFIWKYHSAVVLGKSQVEFTFTDPKNATFFSLMWP